jgi:fatty-acyl-CoA synthase
LEEWTSVIDLVDRRAAETPDAPAVSFAGEQLSYAELRESTLRAARWLRAAGVGSGDRVAILLREASARYLSFVLGAMRLGALGLPINARNKAHELRYVVEHAEPAVFFVGEEFTDVMAAVECPPVCRVVTVGAAFALPDDELAPLEEVEAASTALSLDTDALLLYTSGTTAQPKGCLIGHRALLGVGANCTERLGLGPDDRLWTPMTMFHIGGYQALMTTLTAGGALSHPGMFEANRALAQLEGERCTAAFPAFELIWLAVLEAPGFADADLSALRVVINVGGRERLVQMQEALPDAIQVSCLGMTESCGSLCMGSPADPLELRTTTSGRPLTGTELRIVDAAGEELPPGEEGELLFRGVTAFSGYFRDPDITARTVDEDGWVRTGDLALVLPEGPVQFRGRLKDMLKVGGENVSAPELEDFLISHPAIAVAAVVGAPDARYGEVPTAFVQVVSGRSVQESEVIEFCLGRIATFKVPRYVRVVETFPTSASEKIQKFALRETITAELRERGITEAPKLVARSAGVPS